MKIVYRYFVSIFFISVSIFFIFTIKSLGKGVNREISLKELKKFAENLQNFDELEISQKCLENVNRAILSHPGYSPFHHKYGRCGGIPTSKDEIRHIYSKNTFFNVFKNVLKNLFRVDPQKEGNLRKK